MNTKQVLKDTLKDTEDTFEKLGSEVKSAGRSVWLAGLGAFAEVDEQGRSLFDELVARGRKVQDRSNRSLDEVFAGPRQRVKKVAAWASGTARETADEVSRRSGELLQRFGIPTSEDIRTLNRKVAELNKKVESLSHH